MSAGASRLLGEPRFLSLDAWRLQMRFCSKHNRRCAQGTRICCVPLRTDVFGGTRARATCQAATRTWKDAVCSKVMAPRSAQQAKGPRKAGGRRFPEYDTRQLGRHRDWARHIDGRCTSNTRSRHGSDLALHCCSTRLGRLQMTGL